MIILRRVEDKVRSGKSYPYSPRARADHQIKQKELFFAALMVAYYFNIDKDGPKVGTWSQISLDVFTPSEIIGMQWRICEFIHCDFKPLKNLFAEFQQHMQSDTFHRDFNGRLLNIVFRDAIRQTTDVS